jgi:hypothetical protein
LISDVRQLDPAVLALSNDPQGIELFTGRVVQPSARKQFFGSSESADSLNAFVHKIKCSGKAKLVWFVPNYAGFLYSIEELGQRLQLTPISKQREGVIYDVRPKVVGPRPNSCTR